MQKGIVSDAIIVSGGVSKGDYDLVRAAIENMGRVVLSGVKITPGKPFSFGLVRRNFCNDFKRFIPVFALAGNPTACMSNLVLFVRPAILKMRGFKNVNPPVVKAVMEDSIPAKKGTRSFIWVKLECSNGQYHAEVTGSQKRGVLISVAMAEGLAVVPEDTTINKGDIVEVIVLNWHDDKVL